jgi:hypothetical protein
VILNLGDRWRVAITEGSWAVSVRDKVSRTVPVPAVITIPGSAIHGSS